MQRINGSEAYDLSLFESANKGSVVRMPRQPRQPKQKNSGALQGYVRALSFMLVVTMLLSVVGYMVFCKMQLSELGDQTTKANALLGKAQSENVRLEALMEESTATRNIENKAKELGMVRMSPSQIEYVSLHAEDKIELPQAPKASNPFESFIDKIKSLLS